MDWDKRKPQYKFDYSMFACTVGGVVIVGIILFMIITKGTI